METFKKIFNFLYRGMGGWQQKNGKYASYFRGSVTVYIEFILAGIYFTWIDEDYMELGSVEAIFVLYIIASFFFVKAEKWK